MATNDRKAREKKKARMVSARKMADTSKSGGSKAFTIPQGVSTFIPKKDTEYTIDIIPFEAGEGNPGADKGFLAAGRTYFSHARIGPNQDSYVCPAGTFNKPCPICEYRSRVVAEKGYDNPIAKALRSKTRQLWNVFDHNEPKKGVQIWEVSDWLFGKHLFKKMDRKPEYETFASPDDGYTLTVGCSEEKIEGGKPFVTASDIQFTKRAEPLDEDLLAKATCLDDILVELSYEKLKAIFEQGIGGDKKEDDDSDADEDDKPRGKSKAKATNDEEDDPDEDSEEEKDDPPAKKKAKKPPVDEDDEPEDDEDPDEDDEPAPKKKADKKPAKEEDEDDSDDEDDSEDDEDEPAPKSKKGKEQTAKELGLKVGDVVTHKKFGECDITKISPDGTSLTLEDEDAEEHRAVAPTEVKKVKTKGSEPEDEDDSDDEDEKPAPKKGKKPPVDEDDEDDEEPLEDSDDDDDPPPAKKKAKK